MVFCCSTKKSKYDGFTKAFNGKDFSGWHGVLYKPYDNPYKRKTLKKNNPKKFKQLQKKANRKMNKHWSIKNNILSFDGKGFSIATNKKYHNFEMYVSWKIAPNADSGLYIKSNPQIQIWDTTNKSQFKYGADKGSGGLWNNNKNKRGKNPLVVADKPAGQWNIFFIRMKNDKLTIYLNDKLVVDKCPLDNYWKRGHKLLPKEQIELQAHGSKVQFKDIYIRELP